MPSVIVGDITDWSLEMDAKGHREYTVEFLVECEYGEGPAVAMTTPGLPLSGTQWLVKDDTDLWAWCRLEGSAKPVYSKEKARFFKVTKKFSTKPLEKCSEQQFDDPLLEPMKVSGSFVKYTEEASRDRHGIPLTNSAFEQLRGPQVEFDNHRPQVVIEQNVADLELELLAYTIANPLNDDVLWGLPARCVKLSSVTWEKKYYGLCYVYYTRKFEFDVHYDTFDRYVLDEGTKCIRGAWQKDKNSVQYGQYIPAKNTDGTDLDPDNPANFIRFKDWNGENTRVILNGRGRPYDPGVVGTGTGQGTGTGADTLVGYRFIQKYNESNLLDLGIPTVL